MTGPAGSDEDFDSGGRHGTMTAGPESEERLVINIEGFEGPLDVLLMLAQSQKVDLKQLSILDLVEQYLTFIQEARRLRLELAADYLVMAAWLAYLKSRLLLPEPPADGEPSAEELAARLQFQLQKLEALRQVSARLMSRERLGRDVFARGAPEPVSVTRHARIDLTFYELLKAYAEHRARHTVVDLKIRRVEVYSIEEALARLERLLGHVPDWASLESFVPDLPGGLRARRSARASLFVAGLEMARLGKVELRQHEAFGPLYLRAVGLAGPGRQS